MSVGIENLISGTCASCLHFELIPVDLRACEKNDPALLVGWLWVLRYRRGEGFTPSRLATGLTGVGEPRCRLRLPRPVDRNDEPLGNYAESGKAATEQPDRAQERILRPLKLPVLNPRKSEGGEYDACPPPASRQLSAKHSWAADSFTTSELIHVDPS